MAQENQIEDLEMRRPSYIDAKKRITWADDPSTIHQDTQPANVK
jgi:hypothetical protein